MAVEPSNRKVPPSLFDGLLALSISGDLDGWTLYTDRRGRIRWFPRSPPHKPPSAGQTKQRSRFKTAQANWKALNPATKATWETAVNKAGLCLTGQNLYISLSLTNDRTILARIKTDTGLTLTQPPFVQ